MFWSAAADDCHQVGWRDDSRATMFDTGDESIAPHGDNADGSRNDRAGHYDGTDKGFVKSSSARGAWREMVVRPTAP